MTDPNALAFKFVHARPGPSTWLVLLLLFVLSGCEQTPPGGEQPSGQVPPVEQPKKQEPQQPEQPRASEASSETAEPVELSPEEALDRLTLRVHAYWAAVEESNVLDAYQMEATAKPRGDLSPAGYFQRSPAGRRFRSIDVLDVHLTEDGEGRAKVRYHQIADTKLRPVTLEVTREEPWVLVDGEWYHDPATERPPMAGMMPGGDDKGAEPRVKVTRRIVRDEEAGETLTGKLGGEETQPTP